MDSKKHDLAIIGGGPAGYSAGLYAARAGLDAVVIEQGMPGGQIATSDEIDNYPGIPSISGAEIGVLMQRHAESAGAQTVYGMVDGIERWETGFTVSIGSSPIESEAVIAAMGATPRPAGFEGEDAFRGRGVSYCAACDGMFYRGKDVYVVGGGNTACEEALYLSRIARNVTMVVRKDRLRVPKGMEARLRERDNITIRYLTSIVALRGARFIGEVDLRENSTGEIHTAFHDEGSVGIFVAVGHEAQTGLIEGLVDLDATGAVMTAEDLSTRTPGLFVAGDIRSKGLRQVVTAAADGAIAALSAYRYLEECSR